MRVTPHVCSIRCTQYPQVRSGTSGHRAAFACESNPLFRGVAGKQGSRSAILLFRGRYESFSDPEVHDQTAKFGFALGAFFSVTCYRDLPSFIWVLITTAFEGETNLLTSLGLPEARCFAGGPLPRSSLLSGLGASGNLSSWCHVQPQTTEDRDQVKNRYNDAPA